jgi:hypothetical protein
VVQIFSGIFAGTDGAFEAILSDRDPDIGWFLSCGAG